MTDTKYMDLFERYVYAVGRRLPNRMRSDVENELRSSLQDTLEDRSRELNRTPDEDLAVEVLREMEPPESMADRYTGGRYLIGPRLYPTFITVTQIFLFILVAVHIVGFVNGDYQSPGGNFWDVLLKSLESFTSSALGNIGSLLVVFAILERNLPPGIESDEREWDPRKLPAINAPSVVNMAGVVTDIVFTLGFLVIINFYPEWVGVSNFRNGFWHHYSVLTPEFSRFLLPFNLILGLKVLLNLYVLRQGEWQTPSRWIRLVLKIASIVLLIIMISGPAVAKIPADEMAVPVEILSNLDWLLVIILVVAGVKLLQQVLRERDLFQIALKR